MGRHIPLFESMMHPATLPESELLRQCSLRNERRSGPGGQHRNKVETAVVIEHQPSGIRAEASERRSQADNKRNAIIRLRLSLALKHRQDLDSMPGQPSPLWNRRVVGKQISVSAEHSDYPALLAELLDRLAVDQHDIPKTAAYFQVTASQIVKFLRKYPAAFQAINERRLQLGLNKLR